MDANAIPIIGRVIDSARSFAARLASEIRTEYDTTRVLEAKRKLTEVKKRLDLRMGTQICALCVESEAKNLRAFRTWIALRDHLVNYHRATADVIPE